MDRVTPSELFRWRANSPRGASRRDSCVLAELRRLSKSHPKEVNYAAISRAFGTPKPTLANSYEPELLNLRTFPTLMGYSSRIMAESWESNTLYWAALADEITLPPSQLNVRIPEWTQKLVERIFASHLEDWPAVLKSLRQRGRRCAQPYPRVDRGHQKAELEDPKPVNDNEHIATRIHRNHCWRALAARSRSAASHFPRESGHGGPQFSGDR